MNQKSRPCSMALLVILLVLAHLMCCRAATFDRPVEIVMTMMIRDERVNIESNLGLWAEFVDYFVFLVDERTTDGSEEAIKSVLNASKCKAYQIYPYTFDGFGKARTLSLTKAWEDFPQATHVWIADPDWRPELSTFDKNDINVAEADTYRFLIYDRNGETTRRIDWLLRNREGLAMRYNLHEVLHIGERYEWLGVDWVVREIEKPGTWHATVGHGNSMSAQRYHFDLALLEKDVEEYGHDPHTHYYLGVTHEAVAERMIVSGSSARDTIDHHLDEAIKYLSLRATAEYASEFNEERWGVMMMLGTIYSALRPDFLRAERWFKACKDFNPHQTECSKALCQLYTAHGRAEPLIKEVESLLRVKAKNRIMLNHYKLSSCEIPKVALNGLLVKFTLFKNDMVQEEAMLALLLHAMVLDKFCADSGVILDEATEAHTKQMVNYFGGEQWTSPGICEDSDFIQYLSINRIHLHPCLSVSERMSRMETCDDLFMPLPPIIPHAQLELAKNLNRKITGIGSIPDIVHQVYGGDSTKVVQKKEYNILYVSPWEISGFMAMIKFASTYLSGAISITVVTRDGTMTETVRAVIDKCDVPRAVPIILKYRGFEEGKQGSYFDDGLKDELRESAGSSGTYDYIDMNGASEKLSASSVAFLKDLLSPEGVMGVSAFSKNRHSEQVLAMVHGRNKTAHAPFSTEGRRLVNTYLKGNGYDLLAHDDELVSFLGSGGSVQGEAVLSTKSEIEAELIGAGLKVMSWVPTALLSPFEELPFYEIQQYRSYGLSEESFLHDVLVTFRYGAYAVREEADLPGRLRVSNLTNASRALRTTTYIIDRTERLHAQFTGAEVKAKNMMSMDFAYKVPGYPSSMSIVCMPTELLGYMILGSGPTIHEMYFANRDPSEPESAESNVRTDMFVDFLERNNLITLWMAPEPTDAFSMWRRKRLGHQQKLHHDQRVQEQYVKDARVAAEKPMDLGKKGKSETGFVGKVGPIEVEIGLTGTKASGASIVMPTVQTRNQLLLSSRNPDCAAEDTAEDTVCKTFSTSLPTMLHSSKKKIQFDISQLKYIAYHNKSASSYIKKDLIPRYQRELKALGKGGSGTFLISTKSCLNRAYFVGSEPPAQVTVLRGSLEKIGKGIKALEDAESAFAVVDVILREQDLMALSTMLLTSTVYFDHVNGLVFGGHPFDGIVHSSLQDLVNDLAKVLSVQYEYEVKKYSVYLNDMNYDTIGPLATNEQNEITLLFWMNPSVPEIGAGDEYGDEYLDGARIYEPDLVKCMEEYNARIDPSVHPYFLSIDGDLSATTSHMGCSISKYATETIRRKANRIALIGPGFSYRLGNAQQRSTSGRTFDVKTNVVLSVTLTIRT